MARARKKKKKTKRNVSEIIIRNVPFTKVSRTHARNGKTQDE